MANIGVNIEDVWQQASLAPPPATGSKRSKYTVPVEPHQLALREGFANSQAALAEGGIPISAPRTAQPLHHPPSLPALPPQQQQQQYPQAPPPPHPAAAEIPFLKEQLTQQIDAVGDCQKEVLFLKTIIQNLKRELQEASLQRQHQARLEKKKRTAGLVWMIFLVVVLLVIVFLLVRVSQKLNQVLSQPLLLGA